MTLTGIIFNGMMQGYVGANSIFVYLIENIENEPFDHSGSVYSKVDDFEAGSSGGAEQFHKARMASVLFKIAELKRKQLRLKYRLTCFFQQ